MTTTDTENARKLVASVRAAYDASTQGIWGLTTWAGGFNWGGKKTAYCGTNKDTGEPLKIPATEADNVFIALAHNALPVILDHLASVERDHELAERDLHDINMAYALLVEAMKNIRDYDIAVHIKYGIEDADEQAKTMHRMREIAREALAPESKSRYPEG